MHLNKENLSLGNGGARSVGNQTISHMECHEDETPRFDEKFMKVDASETIINKENLNLGDGGVRSVENLTT